MGLNSLDIAVIVAYLAGVTIFGLRFRGKQRTLKNYFLADNAAPWWAISLSIVAAETSTLTVISVPALAYEKNFQLSSTGDRISGRALHRSFPFHPSLFQGRTHNGIPTHRPPLWPEAQIPYRRSIPCYARRRRGSASVRGRDCRTGCLRRCVRRNERLWPRCHCHCHRDVADAGVYIQRRNGCGNLDRCNAVSRFT